MAAPVVVTGRVCTRARPRRRRGWTYSRRNTSLSLSRSFSRAKRRVKSDDSRICESLYSRKNCREILFQRTLPVGFPLAVPATLLSLSPSARPFARPPADGGGGLVAGFSRETFFRDVARIAEAIYYTPGRFLRRGAHRRRSRAAAGSTGDDGSYRACSRSPLFARSGKVAFVE